MLPLFKFEPTVGDLRAEKQRNLDLLGKIGKRPTLDVKKATNKHINLEQTRWVLLNTRIRNVCRALCGYVNLGQTKMKVEASCKYPSRFNAITLVNAHQVSIGSCFGESFKQQPSKTIEIQVGKKNADLAKADLGRHVSVIFKICFHVQAWNRHINSRFPRTETRSTVTRRHFFWFYRNYI